jgi:ribosomal protein S18 acetylase RimI-like enzyme
VTPTVRLARPDELDAVGELTHAVYVGEGFIAAGSPYAELLRDAAARSRQAELLVAEDAAGRLVGTVTFAAAGTAFAQLAGPDEAEFRMLAVHPLARGGGTARALVTAVLERARAAGARAVVLSSGREMTAAHRLYETFGFRRRPDRDWDPSGHDRLLVYELRLDGTG